MEKLNLNKKSLFNRLPTEIVENYVLPCFNCFELFKLRGG